jgi:lysophospholipase L1-like esterase
VFLLQPDAGRQEDIDRLKVLRIFWIGIVYAIVLCGCKREPIETMKEKEITYLALGDSYTIGESVAEEERYPVQLSRKLGSYNIKVTDTKIIATTGWTTANLKNGITAAGISGKKYDIVSLLIGVNNQFQGRSVSEYKTEFIELLNQSIEFAQGDTNKVFVISIPDYGYTPFGQSNQATISSGIDQFNAVNKQVADSLKVKYFDITPISRQGLNDPTLVATDGLHPSGKMYQQWVELMVEDVAGMINK